MNRIYINIHMPLSIDNTYTLQHLIALSAFIYTQKYN